MKVALYTSRYSRSESIQNPPSLQYLAGYLLKKRLVNEEDILFVENVEQIKSFQPDILGVGSVSQCMQDAIRTAVEVRSFAPFCWNILGGYHISALPQGLPEVFDIGVIGEGELTLAEIISTRMQSNTTIPESLEAIRGVCFRNSMGEIKQTPKRELIEDIDLLTPFRRIPYGMEWAYLFTARGCPFKCVYCASHAFWGKYRFHSAQYVVDQIWKMVEEHGVSSIYFVDDLFIAPKERLREIRRLLREQRLIGRVHFKGFVRVNMIDEEVLSILKEIGFVEVRFGMETASERLLRLIKDRPFTIGQAESLIELSNKLDLPVCASFMFGIPGEDEDDINASRKFLRKHKGRFSIAGFYLLQPVPGTELWETCLRKSLISPEIDFSSLELDMARPGFDWSKILYLNADKIPLPKFKKITEEIYEEFIVSSRPNAPDETQSTLQQQQNQLNSYMQGIPPVIKHLAATLLNKAGYELHRIKHKSSEGPSKHASEKLRGVRLYVGCGSDSREGFMGCDKRSLPGVSIVCNAWEISRYCTSVKEIYSRHMLEHLTLAQVQATLCDWLRALEVGGKVEIIVPDMDYHVEQWRRAIWNEETWRQQFSDARHAFAGFWGWQNEADVQHIEKNGTDALWDVHKCGFNKELLTFLLTREGFSGITCDIFNDKHLVAKASKIMEPGERQVHPSIDGIRIDHRARYEFALPFVKKGDAVLDMACGIGYGAYIIASRSKCDSVAAIDINEGAIEYGKQFYGLPTIDFRVGNCSTIPLDSQSFDLALCFETIEHIHNDKLLLHRFHESLKPGGTLICSTPNQERMPFTPERFPFHVKHYTPMQLRDLLIKAGFKIEQVWSQTTDQSSQFNQGWNGNFNIVVCRKPIAPMAP